MMNETININLNDNTEDGRFSKTNTATDVVRTSTKTKTEPATFTGSTPVPQPKSVSFVDPIVPKPADTMMFVANSASGGLATQVAAAATNPATLSLLALELARRAYNEWRMVNQKLNEYDDLRLRAGGLQRGSAGQPLRYNPISGRFVPKQGSYIRRW